MKILHVVQAYYPALGGSEGLVRNISECLVRKYGDEVFVYTSANPNAESFWRGKWPLLPVGEETINGVHVHRFRVFSGLQTLRSLVSRASRRLHLPYNDWLRTLETGPISPSWFQAIADAEVDIVFATAFPFLHMYYALHAARRTGKPVVLLGSLHPSDPWGYERANIFKAIPLADAYIAHTTYERDYVIARGANPAKVHVIGGGAHFEDYANADGAFMRAKYGWGSDPVLTVMARQSSLKRIDIAIAAMPMIWPIHPQARLLLAGAHTSYSPQIEAMIQALPLDQQAKISVVTNFSEAEKPQLLAATNILVHPSVNESFAIVLVEAWACGKAVIGGDVGAVASLIDPGKDGLLFHYPDPASFAQTAITLLNNPAICKQMGESGRAKVKELYRWESVTAQLRNVYQQLLAERSR